jgi:hypothetical protein
MREPAALNLACGALAAVLLLAASGCVRRTLEVTSEPPGAQLIVNGRPAGFTPAKLVFHFHGTYLIELRKSGYAPVRAGGPVPPRLYELAGPDIVAEVLWPGAIVDQRRIHYKLEPAAPADRDKVLAASRRAAAEAERLIPALEPAPPPNPNARDRNLIHSNRRPRPGSKPEPENAKPPPAGEPVEPAAKPPKTRTIPPPEDVPEIEQGR